MICVARCLIDTGILLRLSTSTRDRFPWCYPAVRKLNARGCELCFTLQNAAEFMHVSTRPINASGHGLSSGEAAQLLTAIAQGMTLLPGSAKADALWRGLIATHDIRGVQVHDAKLVAAMLAHNVPRILTLNTADFARYAGIEALHPSAV